MFRIYYFLLLSNIAFGFTFHSILRYMNAFRNSVTIDSSYISSKQSLFINAMYDDEDAMNDGEIPWDFLEPNSTQKKKVPFWTKPYSYFDEPQQISFLFI